MYSYYYLLSEKFSLLQMVFHMLQLLINITLSFTLNWFWEVEWYIMRSMACTPPIVPPIGVGFTFSPHFPHTQIFVVITLVGTTGKTSRHVFLWLSVGWIVGVGSRLQGQLKVFCLFQCCILLVQAQTQQKMWNCKGFSHTGKKKHKLGRPDVQTKRCQDRKIQSKQCGWLWDSKSQIYGKLSEGPGLWQTANISWDGG